MPESNFPPLNKIKGNELLFWHERLRLEIKRKTQTYLHLLYELLAQALLHFNKHEDPRGGNPHLHTDQKEGP